MSILPKKKCKTCDHIFTSSKIGKKITCPRCGGRSLADASDLDIAYEKKLKMQNKNNK